MVIMKSKGASPFQIMSLLRTNSESFTVSRDPPNSQFMPLVGH